MHAFAEAQKLGGKHTLQMHSELSGPLSPRTNQMILHELTPHLYWKLVPGAERKTSADKVV